MSGAEGDDFRAQAFQPVSVSITAPDAECARRIARRLVEMRLAACVQLVDPIHSVYRWQGEIHDEAEVLLTAKSAEPLVPHIAALLKELHPYQVPELAAVPIVAGSPAYLAWLRENLEAAP